MIEKPDISDTKIISSLRESYAVSVTGVEFLPVGNDPSAWSYRVDTANQETYFLKVKKEDSNLAGFLVSRFLQDHGIVQALAPLPTPEKELWIHVDDFFLVLYPFVNGREAMETGLSNSQWAELGSVLKRIHLTELSSDLSPYVRRETFVPSWSSFAKELHKQVNIQAFDDPYQKQLSAFWKQRKETIQMLIERAEAIGKRLRAANPEFVLCHADIHTANILITQEQTMFIVDWDDTVFAPKERDLLFFLSGNTIQTKEEQAFFDGYGRAEINKLALSYYRYEWCVQEIGDFGSRVFLTKDIGEHTRQHALEGFINLFSKGDVVETALNAGFETESTKLL